MDLIYMSDAMAYQSVRGGPFSSNYYDTTGRSPSVWDNSFGGHRKSTNKKPTFVQDKQHKSSTPVVKSKGGHHNSSGKTGEAVCKICQEQQRRALRSYIRTKSLEEKHERCILEVEENENEDSANDIKRVDERSIAS